MQTTHQLSKLSKKCTAQNSKAASFALNSRLPKVREAREVALKSKTTAGDAEVKVTGRMSVEKAAAVDHLDPEAEHLSADLTDEADLEEVAAEVDPAETAVLVRCVKEDASDARSEVIFALIARMSATGADRDATETENVADLTRAVEVDLPLVPTEEDVEVEETRTLALHQLVAIALTRAEDLATLAESPATTESRTKHQI